MADVDLVRARLAALEAEAHELRKALDGAPGEPLEAIHKLSDDRRLAGGFFYVMQKCDGAGGWAQAVDLSGDVVTDEVELEEAAFGFLQSSRIGKVNHQGPPTAELVESIVLTKDKQAAMGIPPGIVPVGWWGTMRILDDQAWADTKSGKLTAWSIGGAGKRTPLVP